MEPVHAVVIVIPEEEDDKVDCVICQLELDPNEALALPCGHDVFHQTCISQWSDRRNTCPICQATAFPDKPLPAESKPSPVVAPQPATSARVAYTAAFLAFCTVAVMVGCLMIIHTRTTTSADG